MNRPDVSIIIVSWNTSDYLERCLAAIPRAAAGLTIEVIVVDNGSTDGTQAMLAEKFPRVRVIQNPENLGFGRANNIGARASQGRTILFLNSDCELQASALKAMVSALDRDPSLGAVFCRLLNPDGTLQPSVHSSFLSPWSTIGDLFFLSSLRYAVYRTPVLHRWLLWRTVRAHGEAHDVAWGGGACLLISRAALEATGGFDERFFMYCEDMDLCKRIREAGYRLRYLPEPSAIHHWGKSTAQLPAAMLREAYKSRVYYFQKHFPGWGSSVAHWMALRELAMRRLFFCLLAWVPSRRQQSYRDQAAASSACSQFLRGSYLREGEHSLPFAAGAVALLLMLVILFSLFRYVHDLTKLLVESPFIDFAYYYTYATVVEEGHSPLDVDAVKLIDARLGLRRAGASGMYSPWFNFVMGLWTYLPFRQAVVVWVFVNQACLWSVWLLCLRRFEAATPASIATALFVLLNFQPLIEDLALGQSNVVLLFFVTLAWWGLRTDAPWVSAGAVVAALYIKTQYGLLLPLLWLMGYRQVFWKAVFLAGAGLGIGILLLGSSLHIDWLRALGSMPDFYNSWTLNLSVKATLFRLFGEHVASQRALVEVLSLAASAAILVFVIRAIPRPLPPGVAAIDWAWGVGLVAIPLLSPFMEEHHLTVLLLPVSILLLSLSERPMQPKEGMILLGSILLLGSRYSLEKFPVFHQGVLSLLTTGKLLGAVGLAWVLVARLRTGTSSREV